MSTSDFALFGAPPAFAQAIPLGQKYFPSVQRYEAAFRGIFERQYYTEYGPLNRQLEQQLQQFLGIKHAICVTNETVGLMMVANALELTGKVIVPELASINAVQSLRWAGLEPVFCGMNPDTYQMDVAQIPALIDRDVSGIMGTHLWGGACPVHELEALTASHGIPLYFDAAHTFGCAVNGMPIASFGRATVFSFHQDNILNATEGGCICTNDDELAAKLRVMRSSAGAGGMPVEVIKTVNGRMSEAQCAIALLSLEDFAANRKNNQSLHRCYKENLADIPGLHLIKPCAVSFSNFQHVVCRINESELGVPCDLFIKALQAENVAVQSCGVPCIVQMLECKNEPTKARRPGVRFIQLPIGALLTQQAVQYICNVCARIYLYRMHF
jgi:dTDP-4-amino-4,6-dideoxygalactose transaminase